MTNPQGTPIWYDLTVTDPDAIRDFYTAVAGWTIGDAEPGSPVDYRMLDTGSGFAGGLAKLVPEMAPPGMTAGWKVYFGVDDVDATAAAIVKAGGTIHMPPFDLEGVGRMAFVADPAGNVFHIMRGASDEDSNVFGRDLIGRCSWNELVSTDQAASNAFYAEVFGFTFPDKMPMGEAGDYVFIDCAGQQLGATMNRMMPDQPTGWQFYFRVPDIDKAAETVKAKGGTVYMGPHEVPGGERIIVVGDPAGNPVGFVASQGGAA